MKIVTPETLVAEVFRQLTDVGDQVGDRVQAGVELGERTVKEYISTRGTAKSGKAGRIETGKMLRAARGKMLTKTPFVTHGVFGLGDGPYYSVYQERGFRHAVSGEWIEGMFAVTDAHEVVRLFLRASLGTVR